MLGILIGIAAAGLATFAYASLIERNWYAVRRHRVPCLPAGSRSLLMLHISDLHFRRGQRRKRAFIARLAEAKPDLIVCTGDFLDEPHSLDFALDAVRRLHPTVAALSVLGSHDYYASSPSNPFKYLLGPSNRKPFVGKTPNPWRELIAGLEESGWTLLLNRATTLDVEGVGRIDVVGLDDPHIFRDDLSVASPRQTDDFRLGIVHSPDAARPLADLGYDLIMCGHTHGGQVRIPWIGALVTNSSIPRSMARGLHRLGAAWLHVNAGMGTSGFSPFRFACRPEACLLELVPR